MEESSANRPFQNLLDKSDIGERPLVTDSPPQYGLANDGFRLHRLPYSLSRLQKRSRVAHNSSSRCRCHDDAAFFEVDEKADAGSRSHRECRFQIYSTLLHFCYRAFEIVGREGSSRLRCPHLHHFQLWFYCWPDVSVDTIAW